MKVKHTVHNPNWESMFQAEKQRIQSAIGTENFDIHHVGSTALPDIVAQDSIHTLIEIAEGINLDEFKQAMVNLGYEFSDRTHKQLDNKFLPPFMTFKKLPFNISTAFQSTEIHNLILFRDYMLKHPGCSRRISKD
ncbi:MAG: GrpB family protein [Firmicutes bacterium]|nr:GrpB family protein [Bacillota bacterium]